MVLHTESKEKEMKLLKWFKPSKQGWDERMDDWLDKSDEECERIADEIIRERNEQD